MKIHTLHGRCLATILLTASVLTRAIKGQTRDRVTDLHTWMNTNGFLLLWGTALSMTGLSVRSFLKIDVRKTSSSLLF